MAVVSGDIKFYFPDENGDIDLTNEFTGAEELFPDVLDIANDVEKKLWIKNTNVTDSLTLAKFYVVNGFTITNTNNTPIVTALAEIYSHIVAGVYSAMFPTTGSIVITPPSGTALSAQSISCDDTTLYAIPLLTNLPIFLAFDSDLTTGDTATITISDGADFLQVAADVDGTPDTYGSIYSYNDGIDIGTLAAEGTFAVWIKQVVPDGTTNANNPRLWIPIVRGNAA